MRRSIDVVRLAFRAACMVSLAAIVCCAGCAAHERSQSSGPVTIVFKHAKHPHAESLAQLVQQFEAEHPNIRVREEVLPSGSDDQHQFYVINLGAHASDFDVLDMDVIWVPEFARAGWLEDLTAHVPRAELASLNQEALQADWLDHRLYALPWFVDAGVLYYRKDLLAKYGFRPPETYQQLVTIAQGVLAGEKNPRLHGFIWQGMQYEGLVVAALEFIRGDGGRVLNQDGTPTLDEAATQNGLRFMQDLIRTYQVTPALVTSLDEEASRQVFQAGRAVFMRNWPYAWPLLNQSGSPVAGRVGLITVPHFPGHQSAPTLGGFHVGVNAFSKHQKEAAAFVRFMTRQDVQKTILLRLGVLPARMLVYRDPEVLTRLPILADILPSLEQARARPVTPYYPMISQVLQPELSAIVAGIQAVPEASRVAEAQIQHLLGQQ